VHSPTDDDISLFEGLIRVVFSDSENIHTIPSQSLTQGRPLEEAPGRDIQFELLEKGVEMGIGERIAVGKVDLVLIVLEGIGPGKREVTFEKYGAFAVAILVVLYFLTSAMPAEVVLFRSLGAVRNNAHA